MGKYIITFCISTYNRNDGLVKLLDSINDSILSNDFDFTNINVVVVDNFDGLSRNFIQSKTYSFSLDWEHEPKKGLCYARNRTVKMAKETEYLFFVDDDQVLDINCLKEMLNTAIVKNASVVYGSNPPIYNKKPPSSMDSFFKPSFKQTSDYQIAVAPTNCTLIKSSVLDKINGPFDMVFNLTGGEDSFLTRQLHLQGERMYRSVKSIAYELVPSSRCNLKWITKRSFRCATSITIQDKMLRLGGAFYFERILKALAKISFGLIAAVPAFCLPESNKNKYTPWIELIEGLGHIFGYLNVQPKEYDS